MRQLVKKTPWIVKGLAILALSTLAVGCPDDDIEDELEDEAEDISSTIDVKTATEQPLVIDLPELRA